MIKCLFGVTPLKRDADLALLVLRLLTGYAFILHGWGKIQSPMSWMGPESPVPGFFQLLGAVAEFGGGIALIVGLLTRLASFGLICTMAGAVYLHRFVMGDPFVAGQGGGSYELAAIYLGIALVFLAIGPGGLSLDRLLFGARDNTSCGKS